MKKRNSKLALNKETVRVLNGELSNAIGGTCWSGTSDCGPPICPDQQDESVNGCISGNLC